MSQQKGGKLWKKIGKKNSLSSNKISSESQSVSIVGSQIDYLNNTNGQRQKSSDSQENISHQSYDKINQRSLDFFNQIKTLGVEVKQVQMVSQVESSMQFNNMQSSSVFSKMAHKFQTQFLGKKSFESLNNSLQDNYSPMQAIGSPFISSNSNKLSTFKSNFQLQIMFQTLLKLFIKVNQDRANIRKEVQDSMQYFKDMRKIYEDFVIKKLYKKNQLNHSIIDQNSHEDLSQYQHKQQADDSRLKNQNLVIELKKQLQNKINLIQQLEDLIQANKNQYLTFKEMYQKTNQQLNDQLDTMDRKLTQTNKKLSLEQFAKSTIQKQLNQLKLTSFKNSQNYQAAQLRNSASFRIIQTSPTKTVGRIFSFGQNSNQVGNIPNSSAQQKQKNSQQSSPFFKIQQTNSYQKNQTKILQMNGNHVQKLLQLKQKKLKQYEQTIQQLSEQTNIYSLKSSTYQKQIKTQNLQLQKIKFELQKAKIQINQFKQQIIRLTQQKRKYQQYTQNLEENVFDLQQKAEQTQQQCECKLAFSKQQIIQQQTKYKTMQESYKIVLDKISQQSICKNQQNQSHLLIDSPKKVQLIKSKEENRMLTQISHQLQTYKNMYQDKEKEVRKLEKQLSRVTQKNLDIVQEEIQRQTDKFRLQSFRQQSKLKQNILKSYKHQKDQLLTLLNSQREELVEKTNKIDQLQLKISKISSELSQLKSNKTNKNNVDQILNHMKSKKQSVNCDCNKRQKFLLQRQQELHHLQMHLQSQKRMLQVTKRQIEAQYQSLLIKFNQLKSTQLESINNKSIQHLTSPLQNFFKSNTQLTGNLEFRNSLAASPRNFDYQPKNTSLQASRIIQRLKSQGSLRDCSFQKNKSSNKIYNKLPSDKSNRNGYLFSSTIKRSSYASPKAHVIRQDQELSPIKDRIRHRGQSRKLKMKMIEQKMKRLKDQVKNSLSQFFTLQTNMR